MRIKETFISFSGIIKVGIYSYFINIDDDGIEMDINELANQAMHFNNLVIFGKEIFEQKNELGKFIKRVIKLNADIKIDIYTTGVIKPVQIGGFNNITYYVNLQLKNSDVDYEKRINPSIINWFNEIGANFLFTIKNEDDLDEANLIIRNYLIKKTQIFLSVDGEVTDEQLNMITNYAKKSGYNFTLDFRKQFWSNIGKHNHGGIK